MEKSLELINNATNRFGLALTQTQMLALNERRVKALANTGRIEFGEGILQQLVIKFCASPYLDNHNYESTLAELQDIFYHFKSECHDSITDDGLLCAMAALFDGKAGGSTRYIEDIDPREMKKLVREYE